jgi:hypothetical protein
MMRRTPFAIGAALLLAAPPAARAQQGVGLDERLIALTYHKVSGDALDVRAAAERGEAVQRVSTFDRPDAVRSEMARLQAELAAASPAREFVMRVTDQISEYDHDRGEFSIVLFRPGYFVPVDAFDQRYQLVFANAERARAIAMDKAHARDFDARLNQAGRSVVNEIRFRVIGAGDPAGAVTGARVIRAELVGVRLLDRDDRVVHAPDLRAAPGGLAGAGVSAGASGATPAAFDIASADVAGFRLGVKARDLEATLTRMFGPVTRAKASGSGYAGFTETIELNPMGCMTIPGRRDNARPGDVCVTAFLDHGEIVRAIRVERVFPFIEAEVFRRTLVQKYGPVAGAQSGGNFSLGWGPTVAPALLYDRSGPPTALTAHYVTDDDFMANGLNSLPRIRVVLHMVDARWASAQGR